MCAGKRAHAGAGLPLPKYGPALAPLVAPIQGRGAAYGAGLGPFAPVVAWAQGAYKRLKYKAKTKNLKKYQKRACNFLQGGAYWLCQQGKGPCGAGRQGAAKAGGA